MRLQMEGLSEKEKGLVHMDNSVVIAGGTEYKGLNGNEKIQERINFLKTNVFYDDN